MRPGEPGTVRFVPPLTNARGNVLDRLRQGWVTDFLDFHWQGHHWPCFNIADAAICTGVALYILSSFWLAGHPLREGNGKAPAEPA